MIKDESEVEDACNRAVNHANKTPRYPGMSYDEGLRDALEWVLGDAEEDPTE